MVIMPIYSECQKCGYLVLISKVPLKMEGKRSGIYCIDGEYVCGHCADKVEKRLIDSATAIKGTYPARIPRDLSTEDEETT